MQPDQKPRIPYWHLWTDADGISRQTRCFLTEFELQSISRPAQPQWQGHRTRAEMTVMMTVLPIGWTGEWHENPKPQWILMPFAGPSDREHRHHHGHLGSCPVTLPLRLRRPADRLQLELRQEASGLTADAVRIGP